MYKRWEWELHFTSSRAGLRRLALKCALFVLAWAICLSVDFAVRGQVTLADALWTCALLLVGWNAYRAVREGRRLYHHLRQK